MNTHRAKSLFKTIVAEVVKNRIAQLLLRLRSVWSARGDGAQPRAGSRSCRRVAREKSDNVLARRFLFFRYCVRNCAKHGFNEHLFIWRL